MTYSLILVPIAAAVLAQIIKMIIFAVKDKFSWRDINSYGGMPSSHSALVTSLAAMCGYFEGWDSAAFSISLVLALIVVRDAGGFRRTLGRHAQELNQLIHSIRPTESYRYEHLRERIGHTPMELFMGSLLGLVLTVLYILIF